MTTEASFLHGDLTHQILGCAYEVHSRLGPGLLESVYRVCLMHELELSALQVKAETPVPVEYRGHRLDTGFRSDLIVEDAVLVELKAVERLMPIHDAQTLTYLRLSRLEVGLILNFNVASMRSGVRRLVCQHGRKPRVVSITP